MSGNFFVDWASMAVSLANVILLLWLGITVPLTAERRSRDAWMAGSGLLMGAAFFINHTVILGYGPYFFSQEIDVWWYLGWIPVVMLPFGWYVMMLWYTGFWPKLGRQRGGLAIAILLLASLVSLFVFTSPLPSFNQVIQLELSESLTIGGIPVLLIIYPLYVILCIGLALNALRHPAPSPRMMGEQARRRAHPWLIATSVVLLLVSLLVAAVIVWVLSSSRESVLSIERYTQLGFVVGWFDLIIAGLIGLAIILLGQAIIAYAVFTGKTLPHHELKRQWRNAIILALGYGVVVGGSLSLNLLPIYSLLVTTLLMTLFYALLSWRSYAWREHYMRRLRPFVASQHLYEHLLTPKAVPPRVDMVTPFQALCDDILGARLAYLIPVGPLAPLVTPLSYPAALPPPSLPPDLIKNFTSPQTMFISLEPDRVGGAVWAVPLWSERGLIGLLLLGAKRDDNLYNQEEIEIARASGERLIDTQASAEIARSLMALQRQRLTESQLLDRQTRRVLHDDVLPQLHTALLTLSAIPTANGQTGEAVNLLTDAHRQISNLLHEIPTPIEPTLARWGLIGALKQIVADELPHAFDAVTWHIEPEAEQAGRTLSPLTAEVVLYALREAMRNTARHGRGDNPNRPLHLTITATQRKGLAIQVEDNGVGIESAAPSTNGSGQGLTLHSTMLAVIGGTLDVESVPDTYTRLTVALPHET